jgi:hypothetical protein
MGSLLSLSANSYVDVFIDFEAATPTDSERQVYTEVSTALQEKDEILQLLEDYKGCKTLVAVAMGKNHTEDDQRAAFDALILCVDSIDRFYRFSQKLGTAFNTILTTLTTAGEAEDNKESLSNYQALGKILGDMLSFALRFDNARMMKSELSNDFAFYRRMLGKYSNHPNVTIDEDAAQEINLGFTSQISPMMNSIIAAVGNITGPGRDNVTPCLALMANSCLRMIRTNQFSDAKTRVFCAEAMTGCIIAYDYAEPLGVFHRRSPINVKLAIQTLRTQREFDSADSNRLCAGIRYSTKTFRDAPSGITDLF